MGLARLGRPVSALITWEAALRAAGDQASSLRLEVDEVLEERRRQQGMENQGWVFSRWGKAELRAPGLLRECILNAFARADSGQFRPWLRTG